jgi:hypothetical protein
MQFQSALYSYSIMLCDYFVVIRLVKVENDESRKSELDA